MLNYSVKVGEQNEEADAFAVAQDVGANPFPGLRPFTMDECHLFFGREGQVDDILLKLDRHRSVTIMGYSGSGKSSLMNCGVVPVLLRWFHDAYEPSLGCYRIETRRYADHQPYKFDYQLPFAERTYRAEGSPDTSGYH